MKRPTLRLQIGILAALLVLSVGGIALAAGTSATPGGGHAWWFWPTCLFFFTFTIGLIAPVSGVGGGVLFVPIATAFFPFSMDFIRGTGLIMAMMSAFSSTPHLMRKGLANIKLMTPLLIVSTITSIIGGVVGLWITNAFPTGKYYLTIALGAVLFVIFVVMSTAKKLEFPEVDRVDSLSAALDITGSWFEPNLGKVVEYRTTKLPLGALAFAAVGFVAGMFGLGAGWANVPVLNMVMGAPIKVATSTSMAIITINDAAACWIYLSKGALLALILIPAIIGIYIGAKIGAKIAERAKPVFVRYLVMFILLAAGVIDVIKGLGGLGVIPKLL
ncbi:sulfite exporter TauE/SafE family protein [Dissulfurirhabdus thermomarina]|uniref:Probable membrane transporter protein n=1 Tax=Dissulfurirhabdus thermomarina TaxID=1765737 RepID=A0A6N9TJC4_DISTH|nr:sulfite exporter TauE/SafE family protein [Dissulfurirhabdus thermomarina]NDY41362.1 sulfite exporter TauE/SafE family protein [Dissulfurirhabdus thermomarina]NMX23255.1 sulfite exporter TauE/SafE family protein [Dissulfurirhabdus thermomarina]